MNDERVRTFDRALRLSIARRATGGVTLGVTEGHVHVALSLRAPSALGGTSDPNRTLNRHVRPLLRALQSLGASAMYGGRDFVAVRGAPVAWVGASHRSSDSSTFFEAIVAAESPLRIDASAMLGKTPAALSLDVGKVVDAIVESYAAAADHDVERADVPLGILECPRHPPDFLAPIDAPLFDATIDESIGIVGVRVDADRVTLGGDFYASHEAIDALERALVGLLDPIAIGATIDRHLGPSSGAMLIGVRSLTSIRDVVLGAHAKSPQKSVARET